MAGYNCAQATKPVFAADLGIPEKVILRAATGFGGDGRTGGACGSSRGRSVLGLSFGGAGHAKRANDRTYALVQEFIARFTDRNGAISYRTPRMRPLDRRGLSRAREGSSPDRLPWIRQGCGEILDSIISGQSPGR